MCEANLFNSDGNTHDGCEVDYPTVASGTYTNCSDGTNGSPLNELNELPTG
jgi:hypothetical protein